jgi:hypothetical protein
MKADGDLSYVRKGLFRKVIQPSTQTPLLSKGKGYVYKQINAWGDGIRANEYYDHARKSVFNNGFDPVENEVDDLSIVSLYGLAQQSLREDISFEEMEANWDNFNTLDENEPEDAPIENIEETSEEISESEEDIVPSQGVSTKEMTYQTVYKIVDVTDTPMDAYGIALQYIGLGGKIDEDSLYKEVITRRDERLTPKKQTKEESRNRDYVSKNVKSIGRVAEDIWESLDEDIQDKLSDQDIKNAIIDVVGSFNTRLEAAREFVSKYSTQDDVDRIAKPKKIKEEIKDVLEQKEKESKPCNKIKK